MGSLDTVVKVKTSKRQSGGARKIGRNLKKCKAYELAGQREINKKARLKRVAKREARLEKRRAKKKAA